MDEVTKIVKALAESDPNCYDENNDGHCAFCGYGEKFRGPNTHTPECLYRRAREFMGLDNAVQTEADSAA